LALAWSVLDAPAGSPAILNAANEVAVAAFLTGKIRFDQIHHVNRDSLDVCQVSHIHGIDDLLALDQQTRAVATARVKRMDA